MGQRSQIYIRYQNEGKNYLTARYFQWNYGERMISRCRYTIEWIMKNLEYDCAWYFIRDTKKLANIINVNFDMKDVVISSDIINEYLEFLEDEWGKSSEWSFKDFVFLNQDNNNGQLYININGKDVSYAFIDPYEYDKDLKIMNATKYMDWNLENWENSDYITQYQKRRCKSNLKMIDKMARLMTKKELDDFINCAYCITNTK